MRWAPKYKDHTAWNPWFAWYPITLRSGDRVWCETIFRRWTPVLESGFWDYRLRGD